MFPQSHLQNPIFDALYCEEERFDDDLSGGFGFSDPEITDFAGIHEKPSTFLFEHFWAESDDDELVRLLSKEKKQAPLSFDEINSDDSLATVRNGAIKWMLKVTARYGFSAATAVSAVNYYDRFTASICFQKDKPWMSQLAAVACISIAAKVEETLVPLLVDLQVEESKFLFEAKTIQRMELLVLSTLQWKMHPVTPISYFDPILRKLGLLKADILERCENVILSIISDCRLVRHLPSVIASATMLYAIKDMDPCKAVELQNQFVNELQLSQEKIGGCLQLVTEIVHDRGRKQRNKRRRELLPSSPSCVVDSYFSSDSSNDSWVVSSSPEHSLKRSRAAQDQHMMRLGSENSFCWHC